MDPHGRGGGKIVYKVSGQFYKGDFKGVSNTCEGQKYTMRHNENDPEEIQVDDWNPVFVEGEVTHRGPSRIEKIRTLNSFSGSPTVSYTFEVNGHKVEQWQYLPNDFKNRYPNLAEGQYYEVEIWDENVYRSVIHLDTPVKGPTEGH